MIFGWESLTTFALAKTRNELASEYFRTFERVERIKFPINATTKTESLLGLLKAV